MQVPRTLDLRVPVPPRVASYLPLISIVLSLFISIFRLVQPVVNAANTAFKEIETNDPQVVQQRQAELQMPM